MASSSPPRVRLEFFLWSAPRFQSGGKSTRSPPPVSTSTRSSRPSLCFPHLTVVHRLPLPAIWPASPCPPPPCSSPPVPLIRQTCCAAPALLPQSAMRDPFSLEATASLATVAGDNLAAPSPPPPTYLLRALPCRASTGLQVRFFNRSSSVRRHAADSCAPPSRSATHSSLELGTGAADPSMVEGAEESSSSRSFPTVTCCSVRHLIVQCHRRRIVDLLWIWDGISLVSDFCSIGFATCTCRTQTHNDVPLLVHRQWLGWHQKMYSST